MLAKYAHHLVLEQNARLAARLLSYLLRMRDVPDARRKVLVAARAEPVAVWRPSDACDQLLVFLDFMRQLQSVRGLRVHLGNVRW